MKKKDSESIVNLLNKLMKDLDDNKVSLKTILETFGKRAYGPFFFILSLITVTPLGAVPGVPLIIAILLTITALQYMFRSGYPWFPKFIVKKKFSGKSTIKWLKRFHFIAKWIDKITKPRLTFFTTTFINNIAMVFIIILAFSLIPLALVPGGIILPGIVLIFFSIAIITHDGLLMLLGLVGSLLTLALFITF